MEDIIIVGAGGFGREVAWLIERINNEKKVWNLLGFVDDNIDLKNSKINNYPVKGTLDWLSNYNSNICVVCAIGCATARREIVNRIRQNDNFHFPTLIDPSAIYADTVRFGEGCIVCAGTILTVNIQVNNYVIINLNCTLGHDVAVNDYVTLFPCVNVSGCVGIGECSEIGTGAKIIQGKQICSNCIIGSGAVIVQNITESGTYVGVPAKKVK